MKKTTLSIGAIIGAVLTILALFIPQVRDVVNTIQYKSDINQIEEQFRGE